MARPHGGHWKHCLAFYKILKEKFPKGYIYHTNDGLAKECSISKRTVARFIKLLKHDETLSVHTKRYPKYGKWINDRVIEIQEITCPAIIK